MFRIKNIEEKYRELSEVTKASLWFMLCGIIQRCISLLTTPIFTRMMDTTQYGQFTVYQSWLNLFSIITTLRLDYGVFNKGMSMFPDQRDQYTSTMQGTTNFITLVVFFFYLVFRQPINKLTEMSTTLTCLIFLELFFMPAIRFWTLRQRYEYRYKAVVLVTVLLAVVNSGLGAIFVLLSTEKGLARIVSCITVETCFGIWLYIANLRRGRQFFNYKFAKFAIQFNVPLIPYYFSGYILTQADRLMIQKMSGFSAAAIYGIAYNVGLVMTIVSNSVNSALAPWEYEMLRKNKQEKIPSKFYQIIALVFCALVIFMAFAPEVVFVLAGNEYSQATYIIPAVTAGVLFMLMTDLFGNIEFYYGKNKFATYISLVIAVLNIALNYIGIKMFGFIAAGYTTLICHVVAAIAHLFYADSIVSKQCGKHLFNKRVVCFIAFAMIAVAILMTLLYRYPIIRYASILSIGAILIANKKNIESIVKMMKL